MKLGARKAIEEAVADDLQPGETILGMFGAQTGPNPLWVLFTFWILILGSKYRTIVLTNHGLMIHSSSMLRPFKSRELLNRIPFTTPIGPIKGLWSKVEIGGEKMWIHKRFHKDVEAINARLAGAMPPPGSPA